ncbi:40S ribosomal protein S24 [Thelephora terrestris]|uniref:40S ribosomal protein S24 n=1 Tax=Thelephora terrestris TaxID=56493 RepID=A0A9P6HGN7_9AGAM|nr:40S ribosomal protein S24 [Thelephora terrestris]
MVSYASLSDSPVTIRTRKFITNRLLARRQFIVDVLHPERANVPKSELSEKLAALYKTDKARVVTFGFKTQFGGGRSSGFALIYDNEESQKKFEPRYRLVRFRGTKKSKAAEPPKKGK